MTPDVCVCGAGAAGMAAALGASRQGADLLLLEANRQVGGTVTHVLIHTLGGLYDSAGDPVNDGLAAELADRLLRADGATRRRSMGQVWVLNTIPATYARVVEGWLAEQENVDVRCGMSVRQAVAAGGRIVEIEACGPQGTICVQPRAIVDATGTAEVVRLIDRQLVADDSLRAAGSLIFTLRGVAPQALAFPAGIGLVRALCRAAAEGALAAECGKAWIDSGVHDDEAYLKLFVPLPEGCREARRLQQIGRDAVRMQAAVLAFVQQQEGFRAARLDRTGALGIRDGGRIWGEYVKLWSTSSADGFLKLKTWQPCGFTPDITWRTVPSLPAASIACSTISTE